MLAEVGSVNRGIPRRVRQRMKGWQTLRYSDGYMAGHAALLSQHWMLAEGSNEGISGLAHLSASLVVAVIAPLSQH